MEARDTADKITMGCISLLLFVLLLFSQGCTSGGGSSSSSSSLPKVEFDYSDEKFESALSSGKPTILEFAANWCMPCRYMVPVIEEVKKERGDEVNILTVNAGNHTELAAKYRVRGYPTFVLFDARGELVGTIPGAKTEEELNEIINQLKKL